MIFIPPPEAEELVVRVQLVTVMLERESLLKIPPPPEVAELPERVQLYILFEGEEKRELLKIPPPKLAEFPERIEFEMANIPAVQIAPPDADAVLF